VVPGRGAIAIRQVQARERGARRALAEQRAARQAAVFAYAAIAVGAQHVVDPEGAAHDERAAQTLTVGGQNEAQRPGEVRRQTQPFPALADRLAHAPEVEAL